MRRAVRAQEKPRIAAGCGTEQRLPIALDPSRTREVTRRLLDLLAAIPPERVAAVEAALAAAGISSWRVGRVEAAASPGVSLA